MSLLRLSLLALVAAPLGAGVSVSNGVSINGNVSDQVRWFDSAGRTRTASIVQMAGAAAPGKKGGYISQVSYHDGAGTVTCNESGYSVDGLLSGLGHMVNHGGTGNGWVSSNQDGVLAGATTQVLFAGANHVLYQVDMDQYGDNGDASKGTWHNRWTYFIANGQDQIVQSISYDFSSKPAGYWGYTGLYSQQGHDSRSPYCSFNWTGTGAANTLTEPIDGIEWAARDSGTNSYIFRTVGSSPFSGGYTYNTPASNIPYTLQWKNTPDREIGYVSTFDLTQWAAGGGFTSESKIGLTSPTMPADWGVNYQSNGFQGWMGNKMTWGVPYGSAGGALGVSTFNDWTYARTWTGYPTMGYTIMIQLGKSSDNRVRQLVAEQAAIKALPATALTAAVGTVVTLGKMNLQSPAADFSLKPQGYNHLFHAWEVNSAAGAADVTLTLGAASVKNPTFLFNNFSPASLCGLTLNGVSQVEGVDIFTSIDTVNDRLYVTFNKPLTGTQRIVIPASCGSPTVSPSVTRTPTYSAPTATPTQANTPVGGGRQYCLTVNYGAVPALVNHRKLTLKVDVGTCSSVSVSEDGSPVAATYNAGTGIATFTLNGAVGSSSVVVTANGWTSGGSGAATKATLYNDKHWAHSFTFDDGIKDQFTNAKPVFDAKGWRGGLALNASGIVSGNPWNMSWADAQALRASGWDIFTHSWDHPTLTCANFATQFDQNQAQFLTRFPGYNVTHVVYPFEVTSASACGGWPPSYLLSGEGGGGSYNYVDTALPNRFTIQRATFYGTNAAAMQALPTAAAGNARPTWLIVITHSVSDGSSAAADAYSTNAATLTSYLNFLDSNYGAAGSNNLWFAPAGEVYDYLLTRDNAVVSSFTCGTPTPTRTPCAACTATPTMTPSPTASATPSSCPVVLYNGEAPTNAAAGSAWAQPTGSTISETAGAAHSGSSGYNVNLVWASGYWAGSAYNWANFVVGSGKTKDLSTATSVELWIRAASTTVPGLSLTLGDEAGSAGGNSTSVMIDPYLVGGGGVDSTWKRAVIPMAAFAKAGFDPAQVAQFMFQTSSAISGTAAFYFDDLVANKPCPVASPTASPTVAAGSATPTRTPTATASSSPTRSVTPSATATVTPSATATATPSASSSPTATGSSTPTTTRSPTPTFTATGTSSVSPTISPTFTDVPVGSTATSTPLPSATATPTPTSSSTAPAATATLTAPASTLTSSSTASAATATPTAPAATATLTAPASTPTSSSTASVATATLTAPAATATLTVPVATATVTAPAATATLTATVSRSATLTASPSLTATRTATLSVNSPTASVTATPTSSPAPPTPGLTATLADGQLVIRHAVPWPNPNPQAIAFELEGPADRVSLKVYTPAWVLVAAEESGPVSAGWNRIAWPRALQGAPKGLYYFVLKAQQGARQARPRQGRCYLL